MAENGSIRKVYLVENTANTYVIGQTSASLSFNNEVIDTSEKVDEWATNISGNKSWSGSLSVHLDNSATAKQVEFLNSLVEGTELKIFVGVLLENAQSDGVVGMARVTSVEDTMEKGAVSSRSISLTGNGAPTFIFPNK